ncbi:MAG: FdrA family protein [Nocardioidaceae bacterium]
MKHLTVRRGSYVDSVALMQVSQRVGRLDGIHAALVAMATELNLELAAGMGFDVPAGTAPTEMLVALDLTDESRLDAALAEVDAALAPTNRPPAGGFGSAPVPVTIRAAARDSNATVALISTPGQYAAIDAYDAIDAGLHTMLFSDNVPVEQEVALKEYAERAGVLLMGPDCGTAVVGGVGLGFANVVRPGPVGIVAASGTGAQHLLSLLDGADVGISHCLGVGGRDLSEAVGARATLHALALLAADDDTELIVVVSKPPAPSVAEAVRTHAARLGKPVLFGLLGKGQPDLTETARTVVDAAGGSWSPPASWPGTVRAARSGGALRGLFAGGTLCDEAMLIAAAELGPIASNIPLQADWALDARLPSRGNTMIDFGDDRLTQGRPHPMIDGTLRVERFEAEIDDPTTGVVLLDVVLGLGSAADPAGELDASVRRATGAGLPVVVSVIGTRDDPQGLAGQVERLHDAGAWVSLSNAAAAHTAVGLVSGGVS